MITDDKRNLWRSTVSPLRPEDEFEDGEKHDVLIVGGGIMGATAALMLAARGVDCALVEAGEFGAGASSRPGGFVVPSFSFAAPSEVIQSLGEEGEWLVESVGRAGEFIKKLTREFDIDCDLKCGGWHQPAHSRRAMARTQAVADDWRRLGFANELLSGEDVFKRTGVSGYVGGWYSPNGGTIHPLKFTLGMIERAAERGAKIVQNAPVQRITKRNGEFLIDLERIKIRADRVLVCTNGLGCKLAPGLAGAVVRMPIWQCATEPIPASERRALFVNGECLSDTRSNLFTYRFDPEWRLITGALEPIGMASHRIGSLMAQRLKKFLKLSNEPQIDYLWRGEASVTPSRLPEVDIRSDGLLAATACNGRGIALASIFGAMLANTAMQDRLSAAPYGFRSETSPLKIAFERRFAGSFPYFAMAKDAIGG